MMLHETGHLPVWYFPEDDLRADLLEPSEKKTHCPYKGDATYRSIRVGDAHARLHALEAFDVVADAREPDLIRLAPVPMYCSFEDVVRAADALAHTA